MSEKFRVFGNMTERWGQGSYDYRDDMLAFRTIEEAEWFFRVVRDSGTVFVRPVEFCRDNCGHFHICSGNWQRFDVERETAHLDLFKSPDDPGPFRRLLYGPRGGLVVENF